MMTEPSRQLTPEEFWGSLAINVRADGPPAIAACGHAVATRLDLHWSDELDDEVCPDCCGECNP